MRSHIRSTSRSLSLRDLRERDRVEGDMEEWLPLQDGIRDDKSLCK